MRIQISDVAGVIAPPAPKPHAKRINGAKACGRDIARANELRVGVSIAKFGHLRVAEIARAVWPECAWAEQMVQRTCRRMVKAGHILARRNALGGTSYVLTRAGAGWLSLHGTDARHTLELSSVGGATFIHRTLATRYLLERAAGGASVVCEYELANGRLPFAIERLARTLKKLPDGLVWRPDSAGRISFEWAEVENAAKPKVELQRLLRVAEHIGDTVDTEKNAFLGRLTVVFDGALNHGDRLMNAADELWRNLPMETRAQRESAVILVAVKVRSPLVWISHTSMTLREYRHKAK